MNKSNKKPASHQSLISSIHTGFIIFACICVAGVIISLQRKTKQKDTR